MTGEGSLSVKTPLFKILAVLSSALPRALGTSLGTGTGQSRGPVGGPGSAGSMARLGRAAGTGA